MTGFEIGVCVAFGALAVFAVGYFAGIAAEKQAWTSHALPEGDRAVYCNGRFYFIIEEGHFLDCYARKSIRPPQGGSGTAPPAAVPEPPRLRLHDELGKGCMFIGEDLSDRQVACLQLVADVSAGCQFARLDSLLRDATNMTYRHLHDEYGKVSMPDLTFLLGGLAAEGLIEGKDDPVRGPLFGLTEDGKRCNRISVVL